MDPLCYDNEAFWNQIIFQGDSIGNTVMDTNAIR